MKNHAGAVIPASNDLFRWGHVWLSRDIAIKHKFNELLEGVVTDVNADDWSHGSASAQCQVGEVTHPEYTARGSADSNDPISFSEFRSVNRLTGNNSKWGSCPVGPLHGNYKAFGVSDPSPGIVATRLRLSRERV